jgi:hypothetical protein
VAAPPEDLTALAFEGQTGGVEERHAKFAKQVTAAGEQGLLDLVLDAARRQRISGSFAQRFAQPRHGAIEVMQAQLLAALNAVIGAPFLRRPVRARHEQPVQDGQKYGALGSKPELARHGQFVEDIAAAGLLPQPLE